MSKLKDEVINDPEGIGYASMTDAQVVTSLKAEVINQQGYASNNGLLKWAATGPMKKLVEAEGSANDAVASMAGVALALLRNGQTSFDTADGANLALVDALVSAGVLAAGDKTSLLAVGSRTISRAQELGLGRVREGDVKRART